MTPTITWFSQSQLFTLVSVIQLLTDQPLTMEISPALTSTVIV